MASKKRVIAVITVAANRAVQSIGYSRYLPLGSPEILAENLDRWGADEILILAIDRTKAGLGPDLETLRKVAARVTTPISYGGGIRSQKDALDVIHNGADRIVIDSLTTRNAGAVRQISATLGSQAIIWSVPITLENGHPHHYDYLSGKLTVFALANFAFFQENAVSEILAIDYKNEGHFGSFRPEILDAIQSPVPAIAFGGISEPDQARTLIHRTDVGAIAIGNFLSYREHALQSIKQAIGDDQIRAPHFEVVTDD